jgi:hypothetical protein
MAGGLNLQSEILNLGRGRQRLGFIPAQRDGIQLLIADFRFQIEKQLAGVLNLQSAICNLQSEIYLGGLE